MKEDNKQLKLELEEKKQVDEFITRLREDEDKKAIIRRSVRNFKIGLHTTKPSKTIQGEAYTIADLLVKHAGGIMPAVWNQGDFGDDPNHDDEDIMNINRMDFAEKQNLLEDVKYKNLTKKQTLDTLQRRQIEEERRREQESHRSKEVGKTPEG